MRKKMVAGNWKMHGSRYGSKQLIQDIISLMPSQNSIDIVIFPTFIHLPLASELVSTHDLQLGAQNLYLGESGAFTGEVSGSMLKEYGCHFVLVGHSERRSLFHEDFKLIAEKFKAAQQYGLTPILCVGETLQQREAGKTEQIIHEQLASVIEAASIDAFRNAVIAYEPVWAIGTGKTASPEEAEAVHQFIRKLLKDYSIEVADSMRILYGGSVKADNAKGLFAMPNIDGGLVGGASLDAKGFSAICQAAM